MINRSFPQARVSFRPPETIFERIFPDNQVPLQAMVLIPEAGRPVPDSIVSFVNQVDERLRTTIPNRIPLRQHLSLQVDQERLLLYDVDYNTVITAIKTAFNENSFSVLRSYQRFMPIVLGEDSKLISDVIAMRKVLNRKGEELPLGTFVKITREQDLKYITAGEQGEYIPLNYNADKRNAESFRNVIMQMAGERNYPDVIFTGSLDRNSRMFAELGVILVISLFLLYFILAAQFESLLQPLIVLLEIPADIGGALLMLWIFGSSLNIMSGIGIIVMTGVIINDSILKVDTINQLRRSGLPLREAIRRGGVIRLRSIIMTALTTIFGVLPFFFGGGMGAELQRPLSLALIGGMTVGTFVSLLFIPLVYWWIYRGEESGIKINTRN
jgi:multidrug efflux pump subunit AcrB